jgi:hypothetical protein
MTRQCLHYFDRISITGFKVVKTSQKKTKVFLYLPFAFLSTAYVYIAFSGNILWTEILRITFQ